MAAFSDFARRLKLRQASSSAKARLERVVGQAGVVYNHLKTGLPYTAASATTLLSL
jgi:hypothetical protein